MDVAQAVDAESAPAHRRQRVPWRVDIAERPSRPCQRATPPRLSQHGPVTGTRARSEPAPAARSFAMRSRSRCAPSIVESQHRRVRNPHFGAAGPFAPAKRSLLAKAGWLGIQYRCFLRGAAALRGRRSQRAAVAALVARPRRGRPGRWRSGRRRGGCRRRAASASFGALQMAQQRNCASARCGHRCICQVQLIIAPQPRFCCCAKRGLSRQEHRF